MVAKPLKTKSKLPVSRHPLFAPMVALWFAALFGLGSLAIRPALLEAAVLSLRLDLVVPAAAPPLGFTFRILLALTLFVIGGAIGFVLARTMTRDKTPQSVGRRFSSVKAKAESAAPVVVEDFDEDDDFNRLASARQVEKEAANALPGRRRALAMEEDFATEIHDLAPVPGHQPQILDLADLGSFDVEDQPELAEEVADEVRVSADTDAAGAAQEPKFDPWNRHPSGSRFVPAPAAEEETAPAPFAAPFDASADFSRPQTFDHGQPAGEFAAPAFAAPASFAAPANFAAPAQDRTFDAPSAFEVANSESANSESAGHAVDAIVHPVAGMHDAANDEAAPAEEFVAAVTEFSIPPVEQVACTLDAAPSLPVFGTVSGDAAERLVAMPLTSLGVVQLAERLALAIARKRDGAATESAEAAALPEAIEAPEAAAEFTVPEFSAPQPPVPVAFPLPPSLTAPQPMAFAPVETQIESLAEAEVEAEDAPEVAGLFEAPVSPVTSLFRGLPAALRPISFDDHADDEPLPSILPPRSFPKLPEQVAAQEPAAPPVPQSFAPPVESITEATSGEEESYASLLEMKTPPRAFVRIEEPEVESAEVEPVVIFPGQDNRQSFASPANSFGQNANGFAQNGHEAALNGAGRLFDGPVMPNAPMRVPPAMARSIDAEETERQLKAALATLQRMSGAA